MAKRGKRGQNEGSIFKRLDGRWCAVANLGWENGRLKRKYFYADTRKQVSDRLMEALDDLRQGLPVPIGRQTIGQFLDRWLTDCVKPTTRPRTYASYSEQVRLHISPSLGGVQLTKLGPEQVQAFMNAKLESGLSPKTVAYQRSILRMALSKAVRWRLVSVNIADFVDPPKARKFEVEPITPEQSRAFLEVIKGERLEAFFAVALAMGLRRGEALGLAWKDIDLDTRSLRVSHSLQRISGELRLEEVKTKKSLRSLTIPESLVPKLREHRQNQNQERLLAGKAWKDTGLVFTTSVGTPVDPRNVKRTLDRILSMVTCVTCGSYSKPDSKPDAKCKHCGTLFDDPKPAFPQFRVHDLRHFCASLLLAQGVQMKVVSELLGHSETRITADLYTHVVPALKSDAASRMDEVLTGKR